MKKTLFSLAILCFVATSLLAQKKIKGQAHISYEITEVKSQDMMASMMKGSTMDLYITEKNSHSSMNMMKGMMKMDAYTLSGADKPVTLMQMMGSKIKVVDDKKIEEGKTEASKPDFKVNKEITKEIAGYKCYEAKAEMEDGTTIILFVTDKINLNAGKGVSAFGAFFNAVDGAFPLEISFSGKDIGMTMTAQDIESKVDDSVFKYDDEGYKEMTPEELQKMGMGMGF